MTGFRKIHFLRNKPICWLHFIENRTRGNLHKPIMLQTGRILFEPNLKGDIGLHMQSSKLKCHEGKT